MPEAMEKSLEATARKRHYGKKRTARYVYGTMRKTGWVPSTQKKKSASHNLSKAVGKHTKKKKK